MKFPEDFINKVHCADCIDFMKTMPENSVDTIITDPPYNLTSIVKKFGKKDSAPAKYGRDGSFQRLSGGFMGKTWDGTGISFSIELWEEALRVAKPGATLLCFGSTRTNHRLVCAIEDAGWQIKDTICWIFGSGFPKSLNIGKQLQKKSGKQPKVIGRNPNSREKCDKSNTLYESGTVGKTDYITELTDENAKKWNGWGTALKPAVEFILVAMKPNEGSYCENALKWGVAGLNIDGSRIKTDKDLTGSDLFDKIKVCQLNHSNLSVNNAERKRLQQEATKEIRSLFSVTENVDMPILEKILGKMREDINKQDIGCSVEMLMESINTSLNTFISGKNDMEEYQKVGKCIISTAKKMITELKICNVCQREVIGFLLIEIINGIQGLKQGRFPSNLLLSCICDETREGKEMGHKTKGSDNRKDKSSFLGTGFGEEHNENNSYRDKTQIHTNPECPCYMLDKQSGESKSTIDKKQHYGKGTSLFVENKITKTPRYDSGGASRFFKIIK